VSLDRRLLFHLTNPHSLSTVWDMGVRSDVFEDPLSRAAYRFITDYWLSSQMEKAPTALVLSIEFPGLTLDGDSDESIHWLAEHLLRRYATNQLQDMLTTAAVTATEDPIGTLKALQSATYSASELVTPRSSRSDMSNISERRLRYGQRVEADPGATLGLTELDLHTGGLLPGELAAIGAYSKTGKTMFLVNAAVAARRQGRTPIIFTLEMSRREVEDRVDALFSGVSYNRFSHGELDFDEVRILHAAQDEMRDMGPILVERPERGERTVSLMINRARQVGADYVIIDQLSFIDSIKDYRGERATTSKHSEIVFDLKDEIARDSRGAIPCLMAVQFNRDSLNEVSLKSFANTSAIEQTVDLAMGLSRTSDMRANRLMKLDILGSRRSDIASYLLQWELINASRITVNEQIFD
jgi:hypothetical protein